MKDFYINRIEQNKKGNLDIYNEVLQGIFGTVLSWKEVQELAKDKQMKIMVELENAITKHQSKYDIQKLARAIQNSRSGIGGCAMTNFECAFCGKTELWSSTAVPNICKTCAEKMAENIILHNASLEKE